MFEFDLEDSGSAGDIGPPSKRAPIAAIDSLARYDGISARRLSRDPDDPDPGRPSYRDPGLRISGGARTTIRIKRRR